jgi:hypothetical protein
MFSLVIKDKKEKQAYDEVERERSIPEFDFNST